MKQKRQSLRMWLSMIAIALLTVGYSSATDFTKEINLGTYEHGHRVIYEMNVGSFTPQGTFRAAADRLEELKTEGIDIVWLMPIYPRGSSNSPYAPTDFKDTNPKYGTVADLKALTARAHELGMKVWLDWVCNHTAVEADWVTTHPEYYAKSGGQMIHPNNYNDVWQLDYYNANLVNAMNDCLKFWVDECDVDGYRCDYVASPRIPASYWTNAIALLKSYKPGKEIKFLAETDIVEDQTRLKNVGFDYDYAWGFQYRLTVLAANGTSASALRNQVNNLIATSSNLSFNRMVYLTNHDQNYNDGGKTLISQYGGNRYPLTVLTFTLAGMPMLFNGQEIGGNQVLNYFTDTKISWAGVDTKMNNTIRTCAALKHAIPALVDVTPTSANPPLKWLTVTGNSIAAYTRTQGDSQVLVLLNLAETEASTTVAGFDSGEWSKWLDSSTIGRGTSRTNENLTDGQEFTLDAKGYRVYVKGHFSEESDIKEEEIIENLTDDSPCAVFYECPEEAEMHIWLWNADIPQFTAASWPGDAMTRLGINAGGQVVFKYEVTVPEGQNIPTNVIFTKNGADDANKTFDGAFVNHGYYIEGMGVAKTTIPASGVESIAIDKKKGDGFIYNITGQRVGIDASRLAPGIYIRNGEKFVVK